MKSSYNNIKTASHLKDFSHLVIKVQWLCDHQKGIDSELPFVPETYFLENYY